jgi:hypothetical protein
METNAMKFQMSKRGFHSKKKIIALSLFAAGILMLVPKFSAQPPQDIHSMTVPFGQATSCNVQGAAYPVDGSGQMWAMGNRGGWFVTGHIVAGPSGSIAVRNDGIHVAVVCESN